MPIFDSSPAQTTPLRGPGPPSGSGRNFGTMNRLMPLVPGGPPGILASTRWTMLSVRSCSPADIQIFCPVIR